MSLLDNVGLGVDVQEVSAFAGHDRPEELEFYRRVFTPAERAYCAGMPAPAQHFAARFAAKEAVIKALAAFTPASFEQVEIVRGEDGRPRARLSLPGAEDFAVLLSLSHSDAQAVAVAILERNSDVE